MKTEQPTLVLGGNGKTGRLVVKELVTRGVPVRIGSRSASPAFDWSKPATWRGAVQGARAAYVSFYPDIAIPGAPETIEAFLHVARQSDVQRVVLLSGRGEAEAQRAEQVVQASGLDWTVLRCAWFNQNFSESYFLEPLLGGELVLPVGPVPEPFVDTQDIADVAVAALTDARHVGKLYELTGPRLLTFEDTVAEIARATGRSLRFVPVPLSDYLTSMRAFDVPTDVVQLLAYLFGEVLDGRNAHLAQGVEHALGRTPRDFRDYARSAAATGIWNAPATG
jgi:uncharacterized protein YbjT (DUF2867 family)